MNPQLLMLLSQYLNRGGGGMGASQWGGRLQGGYGGGGRQQFDSFDGGGGGPPMPGLAGPDIHSGPGRQTTYDFAPFANQMMQRMQSMQPRGSAPQQGFRGGLLGGGMGRPQFNQPRPQPQSQPTDTRRYIEPGSNVVGSPNYRGGPAAPESPGDFGAFRPAPINPNGPTPQANQGGDLLTRGYGGFGGNPWQRRNSGFRNSGGIY